jgi:hypothetical protein
MAKTITEKSAARFGFQTLAGIGIGLLRFVHQMGGMPFFRFSFN